MGQNLKKGDAYGIVACQGLPPIAPNNSSNSSNSCNSSDESRQSQEFEAFGTTGPATPGMNKWSWELRAELKGSWNEWEASNHETLCFHSPAPSPALVVPSSGSVASGIGVLGSLAVTAVTPKADRGIPRKRRDEGEVRVP